MLRHWTLALTAFALFAAATPSLAEEGRSSEIAVLPDVSLNGDNTDQVRAATGPARDYRVLWADPAIKDFVGPSENNWDFTKPDTIPGFGSLPYHDGAR